VRTNQGKRIEKRKSKKIEQIRKNTLEMSKKHREATTSLRLTPDSDGLTHPNRREPRETASKRKRK
jgi:hypothetical protein